MVFGEYCHAANREWYSHGGAWSATVLRQVVDMNVTSILMPGPVGFQHIVAL